MTDEPHNDSKPDKDQASSEQFEAAALGDRQLQKIHGAHRREKNEPEEMDSPIPMALVFFIMICMMLGGFYMARYSGGFSADVFDYTVTPGVDPSASAAPFDPIKAGKRTYSNVCATCHQPEGQGQPGVYPPLAGSEWVLGNPETSVAILLYGMNGPVTVKGNEYNGQMPTHGHFKDRDIAAVLTYVRQAWGNDAPPIEEALVKEIRSTVGDRAPWSAEELLAEYPYSSE